MAAGKGSMLSRFNKLLSQGLETEQEVRDDLQSPNDRRPEKCLSWGCIKTEIRHHRSRHQTLNVQNKLLVLEMYCDDEFLVGNIRIYHIGTFQGLYSFVPY